VSATLFRRAVAEALGTAFLLAAVVGSGIMGARLADGNVALTLLANSLATAGALVALILTFGPISGAHFNPVVTLAFAWRREFPWREVPAYLAAQVSGACAGVIAAHLMFALPAISVSAKLRAGPAQMLSEAIATFGLVGLILVLQRARPASVSYGVACYIGAAYWFTASTSFANPAVALARCLTDSFAGIRPGDVPGFVLAEFLGAAGAVPLFGWFLGGPRSIPGAASDDALSPPE
jgi:glycerol uptake facilitator-like aquaporin